MTRNESSVLRVLTDAPEPAADCPDDAELAEFLDRRLARSRKRELEAHFDQCSVCRELVFALASVDPEKTKATRTALKARSRLRNLARYLCGHIVWLRRRWR